MQDNRFSAKHLIKYHLAGGAACVLIAGASLYFAGSSISKRRGLFLSARQELASAKSQLNESISQRTSLASRVHGLEQETAHRLDLVSVRQLNARTAEIVELAESVEVRIDSLQPLERVTDKRVPVQPMEFRGVSDASRIFSLLKLLSERMPDIHVQSIDLVNTDAETSSVQITMRLCWFIDPADADQ